MEVLLREQLDMVRAIVRVIDAAIPEARAKGRGRPAAEARLRDEAERAPPPPRPVYGFQSPFGRPPAKVPMASGGQAGNRNAVTHGRTTAGARTRRREALGEVRAIARRLRQLEPHWPWR